MRGQGEMESFHLQAGKEVGGEQEEEESIHIYGRWFSPRSKSIKEKGPHFKTRQGRSC